MAIILTLQQHPEGTMRIIWNSGLELGVRAIDDQHEELIGILNEFEDARAAGMSLEALKDALARLDAYVIFHFSTEESLMARLQQPGIDAQAHHQAHRDFAAALTPLRERAGQGDLAAFGEFSDYLALWLREHILKTDRQLATALQQHASRLSGAPPKTDPGLR